MARQRPIPRCTACGEPHPASDSDRGTMIGLGIIRCGICGDPLAEHSRSQACPILVALGIDPAALPGINRRKTAITPTVGLPHSARLVGAGVSAIAS